jgi:hypothetical protein
MKIIITRAFERTRQIADFVPIKAYCEATVEFESADEIGVQVKDAEKMKEVSGLLDNIVQSEVDNTLKNYRPTCITCGGRGERVLLNKEGQCGQCVSTANFAARDFKKDNPSTKLFKVEKPTL